jgi:hypothetical protein
MTEMPAEWAEVGERWIVWLGAGGRPASMLAAVPAAG